MQKLETAVLRITICLLILLGLLPILKLVTMETCSFALFVHAEVDKTWRALGAGSAGAEQPAAPLPASATTPPRLALPPSAPAPGGRGACAVHSIYPMGVRRPGVGGATRGNGPEGSETPAGGGPQRY